MYTQRESWFFAKDKPENFIPIELPHDWLISQTNNFYESGIGWYRRELDASFIEEDQHLILHFDGVYMDSTLFVNDHEVGTWKYGWTAFEYDITAYIHRDKLNTILVRVAYMAPSARWYTGAGIYRDVTVKVKNSCHFITDGIYIHTFQRNGHWTFEAEVEVQTGGRPYEVRHTILDGAEDIKPWDIDNPYLYTVHSELLVDGVVTDSEYTRIGFRTIEFSPEKGFLLNGKPLRLKGVCLHHDLGALGAAVYPDAIRRQLRLFKAMGVNALRTAHNPPAKAFMDLAEELGFLVMSEILDVWKEPKNQYDYSRFFDEWIERDVASWIRRDRNCPSVILWSVGNEIPDTHKNAEEGIKTLQYLLNLVKKHDPKGNAYPTLCSNYMPWDNTQKCADLIKLIGYNYGESLYSEHHRIHPDWIIYGSETCSTVQSRGVYRFPLRQSILADDDLQCSALGNSATSWGAESVEACLRTDQYAPFSLGQFIWAGQDYIGEPTPYHTKSSYLGHVDTAGFPKDSYYLFQAAWTDYRQDPMIHLFPYWDFSPGQCIDIRVCSNAPEVELFFNEKSLGKVCLEDRIIADWQQAYSPGVLRAVAYDHEGNIIAEAYRRSFGDVQALNIQSEEIGKLIFSRITAIDRAGNPVENANSRVHVSVEEGTLLGLDNGDSTDQDPYQTDNKRLFNGKLLAITKIQGTSPPRIKAKLDDKDRPIRKIELHREGYIISAHIFPENASYNDLSWRLSDAAGIDSPLGTLELAPHGRSVRLLPKGDGVVHIRCSAKNGRTHPAIISQLEFTIQGLGKCFMDPYSFIAGALYTRSNVELTNGNERGIATQRDGESHVGYQDLDFGAYGSDELTIPLFPFSSEPFKFDIWDGMPLEGGEFLCSVPYDLGSIWNSYQDLTCRLPRRLRGVRTLCFVFRQKVHMKGFNFKKFQKGLQRLPASEYDAIYGDSFTMKDEAVENIGNNVSLVYKNMDFGTPGITGVELCWRSKISRNSIQFIFSDSEGENKEMIELGATDSYGSGSFRFESRSQGCKTVTLLFLPGSDVDLAWFQFLP